LLPDLHQTWYEIINFNIWLEFEKVTNYEQYFLGKSFSNLIKIQQKYVCEVFYNTQVQNCLLIATIKILSSKPGSISNLKFIMLFGIPVKTNGVQSQTLLKNVYIKICFSG